MMNDDDMTIPIACSWAGCHGYFIGPLPPGWIWLATFWMVREPGKLDFTSDDVNRDAALCPEHAAALESLLKPL